MKTAAVIVAAGRGTRMGGMLPKQYQPLAGRAVLEHTIAVFADHPAVSDIVVVTHPEDADLFAAHITLRPQLRRVDGGASRDLSVQRGLAALDPSHDAVLIHDAARPLVSPAVIDRVLQALAHHAGAAPALAVTDALWHGEAGKVMASQPRDGLYRAQTPQGFRLAAIRHAHEAHCGGAADDVEVARAQGLDVAIVQGDEANLKLTRPEDVLRAERIMAGMMDIRTGNGFDVHRFGDGDHVMLCGVKIPHPRGLQGHSDADVGMHAVTDAIYGALAQGDIGRHFPPSDPQWKGAASSIFLQHAVGLAKTRGFSVSNADCTLICEQPKIGPHAIEMQAELARLMQCETERISVKATTSERLGFTGRKEGIAAIATVTLVKS